MMGPILNLVRREVQRALANYVSSREAVVTSYDPARYAAKVTLQPDGAKTGWLPVAAHWIGNGWGFFSPPGIGDQVKVEFSDGDIGSGTIIGRIWDDNQKALSAVQSGEAWLVHKHGQAIKLTNDGKLTMTDGHGATIVLDGSGNINSQASQWNHTGPVHFSDNVQVDKTLTATTDVIGGNKSLKNHTHGGVQTGGGNTAAPN